MEYISSSQNAKYKIWTSLLESRGIKKHGLCLLSGSKLINEHHKNCDTIIYCDGMSEDYGPGFTMDKALFKDLDIFGTKAPLAIMKTPDFVGESDTGIRLYLPMGDPANLGAMIRSAVAFNVSSIVLMSESANPFHPKCLRASSGAVLKAPLVKGAALADITTDGLFVLDAKGDNIFDADLGADVRLLVGEEGPGIPAELLASCRRLSIPTSKDVESLNAAVAGSVALAVLGMRA